MPDRAGSPSRFNGPLESLLEEQMLSMIPETWVTHRTFCEESKVPWQESNPMDERLKLVARLLDKARRWRSRRESNPRPSV